MPKIAYIEKRFNQGSVKIIALANQIIEEYMQQGFKLTLRQLYYQFVSRDLLANRQTEYKRLGKVINDARMAGWIDWHAIEDRTRNLKGLSSWDRPEDILESAASSYKLDAWDGQDFRPEVWIEKDALVGVIQQVCNEHDVPFFACRGYTSQSEQWAAGRRFAQYHEQWGQIPVILHLGDHDPSGIDMTRDNDSRLSLFSSGACEIRRLALNMDQVNAYNPPPNPAKLSDSRCAGYVRRFGPDSWELDALEPSVISDLIRQEIDSLIDWEIWRQTEERQERHRRFLTEIADRSDEVGEFLGVDFD